MAIATEGMKLEALKDQYTQQKTLFNIGKHFEKGSINERLSIEHHFNFKSLLGNTYSINNFKMYLTYQNAKPAWINTPLRSEDYIFMKTKGVKRDVPNYWNIITLVLVDRILADKKLVNDMNNEFKGSVLDTIRIMPMIEVKRGITKVETFNDKLKTYGIISGINIRQIVSEYRNRFGDDVDIEALDKDVYKEFKNSVKSDILDRIFSNLKSDNLFDGFDDSITNDDVRAAYLR